MDLKLSNSNKDGIEIVDVEGEIDVYTAPRLRELLIELVNKKFDPERNAVVANFDPANTQVFINKARLRELGLSLSQIKAYLEAQPFIYAAYTEDEIERAASLPCTTRW